MSSQAIRATPPTGKQPVPEKMARPIRRIACRWRWAASSWALPARCAAATKSSAPAPAASASNAAPARVAAKGAPNVGYMDAVRQRVAQLRDGWKPVYDILLANPSVTAPYLETISAEQIDEIIQGLASWLDRAKAPNGFAPKFNLPKSVVSTPFWRRLQPYGLSKPGTIII